MSVNFEPGAMEAGDTAHVEGISREGILLMVPLTSIAISLKRIADALHYKPGDENIFDFVRQIARSAEESVGRR